MGSRGGGVGVWGARWWGEEWERGEGGGGGGGRREWAAVAGFQYLEYEDKYVDCSDENVRGELVGDDGHLQHFCIGERVISETILQHALGNCGKRRRCKDNVGPH